MKAIYIIAVTVIWFVSLILIIKYVPEKKEEPLIFPFPLIHSFPKEENSIYQSNRPDMSTEDGWALGRTDIILGNTVIKSVRSYGRILTDEEIGKLTDLMEDKQ